MKRRITIWLAALILALTCANAQARVKKARFSVTLAETAATSLSVTKAIAGPDENRISGLLWKTAYIVPALTGTTVSASLATADDGLTLYSKANIAESGTTIDTLSTLAPISGPLVLTLVVNSAQTTAATVLVVFFSEE